MFVVVDTLFGGKEYIGDVASMCDTRKDADNSLASFQRIVDNGIRRNAQDGGNRFQVVKVRGLFRRNDRLKECDVVRS